MENRTEWEERYGKQNRMRKTIWKTEQNEKNNMENRTERAEQYGKQNKKEREEQYGEQNRAEEQYGVNLLSQNFQNFGWVQPEARGLAGWDRGLDRA